ncbi:KilA domain-containing protein [Burkholderia lata]|nr:KilA domain-containing protein [Burkholderia lata]
MRSRDGQRAEPDMRPFLFDCSAIRVVVVDGAPMFVARDVAGALGYTRTADAIRAHCKGSVKRRLHTSGGAQDVVLIPERDVYRLVFRSKLPAAERFEEWVVGEVLPAIRTAGRYAAPSASTAWLQDRSIDGIPGAAPDRAGAPQLPADILRTVTALAESNAELARAVQRQAPKAAAYDQLTDAEGTMPITQGAKSLGVAPSILFQWLERNAWIYRPNGRRPAAYETKIMDGLLVHRTHAVDCRDGTSKLVSNVHLTSRGLVALARHVAEGRIPMRGGAR